jgi:hypothetical protein
LTDGLSPEQRRQLDALTQRRVESSQAASAGCVKCRWRQSRPRCSA